MSDPIARHDNDPQSHDQARRAGQPPARVSAGRTATTYQSPDGTYEIISKAFLERTDLSDRAYRLAAFLASKPDGWRIRPAMIAVALRKSERWWVDPALAELAEAGIIRHAKAGRDERGRFTQRTSAFSADGIRHVSAGQSTTSQSVVVVPPAETQLNGDRTATSHAVVVVPPSETASLRRSVHDVAKRRHIRDYGGEITEKAITAPAPRPALRAAGEPEIWWGGIDPRAKGRRGRATDDFWEQALQADGR